MNQTRGKIKVSQDDVEEHAMGENLERLNENLAKIEALSKRLVAALGQRHPHDPGLEGPGPELYLKSGMAYFNEMMTNPAKLVELQVDYWGKSLTHFMEVQQELAKGHLAPPEDDMPGDKRFANPLWRTHPYFNYVKHQYLLSADAIRKTVEELEGLEPKDKQRVEFFAQQMIDLCSPTNYFATNPDALERAVETDGQSLVQGLENLVRDLEAHGGELLPTLSDPDAFEVGKNLATTPGAVVYRNRMMELIQYTPTTETVHRTPLIIFPPWINKFYIMDLKEKNSLIRWIVDQGYTLFVVSWVNPSNEYAETGLTDYIEDGYLKAIEVVKEITEEKQVNAIGYCIAGTTLSMTLALMKARGDKSVKSATFFTTLTDFSDKGEFTPFLADDFVDAIMRQVDIDGMLNRYYMARTFTFLRARDLVYGPAVRSYMMGEAPPAFDLLFWNGDNTNLPGKMARQYLRGLCQANQFAEDGIELCGETLRLKDVTVPLCSIAAETDHIAAWKHCYHGVTQMGSRNKTFILSESGHIAGIINPPSKKKYGHYTNPEVKGTPDEWLEGAEFNEGSWWPRWEKWLAARSGKQVESREPDAGAYKKLADAPGTYVVAEPTD